jgi:pimeloyl-ACP methyl ester carboxylesterase
VKVGRPEAFEIRVPDAVLGDLRRRLAATRWPDVADDDGWGEGVPLAALRELCAHWAEGFDWRAHEAALNAFPQLRVEIDGVLVHALHVRGRGPDPLPLVLTHGWPSSIYELTPLLPLLTDPAAHGGDPRASFDVVVPALPGYPCSPRPPAGTWARVPALWRALMTDALGYDRFGAAGGDLGAIVTAGLGRDHADVCAGILVQAVFGPTGLDEPTLADDERAFLEARRTWAAVEGAYAHQQATRPRTLSYGLADSPAGLLAWALEKYVAWTDPAAGIDGPIGRDALLVTPTLYVAENCVAATFAPYREAGDVVNPRAGGRVRAPTAVAAFPADLPVPVRRFAERHYPVERFTVMPRGGHFAALEVPDLLAEEIRAFFAGIR